MTRISALLLAAILAAAVPTLAEAQDAGAALKADAQKAADAVKDAAGTATQAAGEAVQSAANAVAGTTDDLAARMTSGPRADVRAVTDGTPVKIVALSTLKVGTVADAVNNIISENTDWMTTLRTDVAANDTLNTRLEAAGYNANEVVYAEAQPDGSVTVYVDDGK